SIEDREEIRSWLMEVFARDFPEVRARISRLENGPPVGYPIQFRISGEHIDEVRRVVREVDAQVRRNSASNHVTLSLEEPNTTFQQNIDQERERGLCLSAADVFEVLASHLTVNRLSQFRQCIELSDILLRATSEERDELQHL